MITQAVLELIGGLVAGLAANLPSYELDTEAFGTNAAQIGAWASALNGYAPIVQLGAALTLLVGLKLALLSWQGIVFVYHQFWGSS